MKNRLTKLFIALFAIFSFALMGLNLMPQAKASAFTATEATYTISNTGNTFSVKKGLEPSQVDLGIDLATLEEAFETILGDPDLDENATVEVVFNTVTISTEEQITLSRNFIFSGVLNIENTSSLFISENPNADKDQEIVCDNLVLTNISDTLSNFAFFEANNSKTFFTLKNADFNIISASSETTHAIKFNSNTHKLLLKGIVTHDTTYLYNYTPDTLLYLDQDNANNDDFYADNEGNPIETTEQIKIAIPYTANNSLICSNIEYANTLLIDLVADDDFFTVSTVPNNSTLYVAVESNFTFNTNGGTFATADAAPITIFYNNDTPYTFPDQTKITKEYHHFIGWFGQIEYNSQTYYFDQTLIEEFVAQGSNPATIPTIFKTDLSTFVAAKSFTNYAFSSKGTAEQYAKYYPVTVMAENGQAPTFIAKWALDTYDVTFNTNGGTAVSTETYEYGSTISEPATIPTKTGYTFDKWYKDAELTTPFDFAAETMPAENIIIYAGYTVNNYTITFVTNTTETTIDPITYNFGAEIADFAPLSKEGHTFEGWFLNEGCTTPFEAETMPAENITVYAKWTLDRISVYFNSKGGSTIDEIFVDYGTYVTIPAAPTKTGSVFDGWYYDYNCTNDQKVVWTEGKLQVKTQLRLYAKWIDLPYHLVFQDGNNRIGYKTFGYGATIELLDGLIKDGYTFGGWYADEALTTPFTLTSMPAENTYVYAKWISKIIIDIDESTQKYVADAINPTFELNSDLQNFVIKYKVNGEWVMDAPTDVGTYDVMITRNEDEHYARFESVIEGGYVIEPIVADYTWLIAILFAVFALEIIVSIAVRILRKLKKNMVITSLAIVTGNIMIPSNQVVLIIISAICAVAGFVVMCYQLVKLHRTLPLALITPEEDNDSMEKHFKHSEKVIAEETHSYSAQDVEDMLLHDTVGHAIKEKHNLNELEKEEIKERVPIGPLAYSEEHDNMQKIEDEDVEQATTPASNVEIVDDEFIANDTDDNERLYNSDDPFLRKDPTDYNIDKKED